MPVYLLLTAFTVWMAVEAVRRGQAGSWLWIILLFGPIGAAVYFFSEVQPLRGGGSGGRTVAADELRRAEADVKRLDTAAAWTHLASLRRIRRQFGEAAAAAEKAVERDSQGRDARYELGLALLGAGRPGAAVPHLRHVVEGDRWYDSGDALFALGEAEKASGDFPAARAHLEELSGRSGRPEILYSLAEVQVRLGDEAAASQALTRIVEEAELVPPYLQRSVKPWVRKARRALKQMGRA